MGTEGSLQCSQKTATGPCLEPGENFQHPYILFIEDNIFPSTPRSSK
jgi:hypothetical protein